jgi:hypothetical protein
VHSYVALGVKKYSIVCFLFVCVRKYRDNDVKTNQAMMVDSSFVVREQNVRISSSCSFLLLVEHQQQQQQPCDLHLVRILFESNYCHDTDQRYASS